MCAHESEIVTSVNNVWPARNWLLPGLALVQVVLITFPLYDVCRSDAKRKAAQHRNSTYGPGTSIDNMMNIIDGNSQPLVEFAARTRFNAELIIFLRDVKKWRTTWTTPGPDWAAPINHEERVAGFKHAALIYYKLVNVGVAAFAINIDEKTRRLIAEHFTLTRYLSHRRPSSSRRLSVLPWEDADPFKITAAFRATPMGMADLEITLAEAEDSIALLTPETVDAANNNMDEATMEGINMAGYSQLDAPETFSLAVFDEAYKEVKQEAYYNVWLPYVKSGRYRQDFSE